MVGVRHLLWGEVVGEIAVAPGPPLEGDTVLARALQALLDGLMGQPRQFLQFLHQARPAAFSHPDDRNARVIDVVQLVVAVGVKTRYAGGRQGSRGPLPDNGDLP